MKPGDRVLIAETDAIAIVLDSCKVEDMPELGIIDAPVEQVKSILREGNATHVIVLEHLSDASLEAIFQLADTSFCDERGQKRTIIPLKRPVHYREAPEGLCMTRPPDKVNLEGGLTSLPEQFRQVAHLANQAGLEGHAISRLEYGVDLDQIRERLLSKAEAVGTPVCITIRYGSKE